MVELKAEKLPVVSELPGRISATITADIRPRITGLVLKRQFEQGATVREGEILYLLDPAPFQAKVDSAAAALASAQAAQQQAAQQAERQQELRRSNVTSQQEAENAQAALAQANAEVDRAEADLQTAKLDLQYTEIRSPITGRIGRALVTEGALVSPTSDVLATITQMDPVYADFTQTADNLLRLKNAVAAGNLKADESNNPVMSLIVGDGRSYAHQGKLLFSEATVNASTGQVIMRAEFPNPEMNLLPGMYVRGLLEQAALENAVAVPKQAVQHDTAGKAQVLLVNEEGVVEARNIQIGWAISGRWVVIDGLKPGEHVIVEGMQKVAPGATVAAEPWAGDQTASAPGAKE